jgi:putative sterol carrier protein
MAEFSSVGELFSRCKQLAEAGCVLLPSQIRFDLGSDGDFTLGPSGVAGCVVRTSSDVLLGIASGAVNPQAAFIAGSVQVEGDVTALLALNTLFEALAQ